ncbi:MAG TPA: hypothetical protein VK815_13920 [Candidatus Acidoferrales bacterium]|jgi:hypothetical protein|nr:hypothetical protein [Candidatus Acidoferrales bacterium]
MFNLEASITNWRREMFAAGLNDSSALDELESHLRDDIEQQTRAGRSVENAFTLATRQIGRAAPLKTEFAKTGETLWEQIRHILFIPLPLPKLQLANHMNTTPSNLEPRWATYSKTVTFVLPAIILWVASAIFVLPKLKQICQASGTIVPGPLSTAMALSGLFKDNLIICSALFCCTLVLLEWRSSIWSRHRRLIFGVAAFTLNSVALVAITAMFILAVLAGSHLLPQTR